MAAHSANDRYSAVPAIRAQRPLKTVADARKRASIGWLRLSGVLLMAILVAACAPTAPPPAPTTAPAPTAAPQPPTPVSAAMPMLPPSIARECEYPDQATVGQMILRSSASGTKVHGQFGAGATWSAQPGYVQFNISVPQSDHLYLTLRYSKYSPPSTPIRIYIDGEPNPRATFQPIDQGSWNQFAWSEPILLGSVGSGDHTIRFTTNGQQYGVADLDTFVLWP